VSTKPSIEVGGMTTVSDEAVFFSFDDYSIPARSNLELTMKQAEKYAHNPVLKPGASKEPDARAVVIYGSVRYIKGKFRMWYLAEPKLRWERDSVLFPSEVGRPIAYAESNDGIHWEKPSLGLVKFRGSKDNNLVLIEPEGHPLSAPNDYCCVLYDPEDPDRCYKMVYIVFLKAKDFLGDENREFLNEYPQDRRILLPTMACATSQDGLHWKLVHKTAPIKQHFEVAGLYKFNNKYYAEGQTLSPWVWLPDVKSCGRVMVSFESKDFITWSKSKVVSFVRHNYESCPLDQNYKGEQVHMGAGIWNRGNVLLGVYGQWHGDKTKVENCRIDLGLIVSNDGLHFREPLPNFALVPRGQEEEWDSLALTQGHAFENVNDKTYIWYGQWDITEEHKADKPEAIGLAILRRDGFGYLSAKYSNLFTHFLTCPVKITDGKVNLFLNIEGVCKESPIRVALVDDAGIPLRGYTETDCVPIVEQGVSVQVKWQGENTNLPQDIPFRVKVIFPKGTGTKFYAGYIR